MADPYRVVTSDFVSVFITSTSANKTIGVEKRFQKGITIGQLKGKLELITGGGASTMKLEIYNKEDHLVCALDDDKALLGSYPVDDGMRMHVIDKFTIKNEYEDVSKVEKFELTEEEYSKRGDTVKSFLAKNKLGKYNEEETRMREEERKKEESAEEEQIKSITVGSRCEVSVPGAPMRRGTVMYTGKVDFKPGWWIGIKYDEPLGKNNGSVNGKQYFECPPKFGGFVKPGNVTVGDFPEEDYGLDEEL